MIVIKSQNLKLKRLIVFIIYITLVLTFTFIVRETLIWRYSGKHEAVFIPFRQFIGLLKEPNHMMWFWQIFLNIILFIPFGFMFPIIHSKSFRKYHLSPVFTIFIGFALSFFIEVMQYITGRGLADIDDLINNTLGAVIGYLVYKAGKTEYERKNNSSYL